MDLRKIDWDMLAEDVSAMLDKYGYSDGDVCDTHVRPHLEEFMTKVAASAAADE
jgi:hypothetical protein